MLDALSGKQGVVECAFVKSDLLEASYFASPIELGVCLINKSMAVSYGLYS